MAVAPRSEKGEASEYRVGGYDRRLLDSQQSQTTNDKSHFSNIGYFLCVSVKAGLFRTS